MNKNTLLNLNDNLPLTCTRTGSCCYGKKVLLNPWELSQIAIQKNMEIKDFRNNFTEYGGIQLRFDGILDSYNQSACSQYLSNLGCSVHRGRPLACRLYPLGRQIQSEKTQYIYQGNLFPCLKDCREVNKLPYLQVGEYLNGQETKIFEDAQDAYLEVMQNLADIAFSLYLDTELASIGDIITLDEWKKLGKLSENDLVEFIGQEWIDTIMLPEINITNDPIYFAETHNEILQEKAQNNFGKVKKIEGFREASIFVMGLSLYMATSLGANPLELSEHWSNQALKISEENK